MFVKEEIRHLARIVRVDNILSIPKADRLEIAVVGGWECVVQKGMYQKGDEALYFEIDAAIALDNPVLATFDKQYLNIKKDEFTGQEWAVIRTIRLRGAVSQGLLISPATYAGTKAEGVAVGTNVTESLGVLKYVSPEEAKLYATAAGATNDEKTTKKLWWKIRAWLTRGIVSDGLLPFPYGHVKSDEDRVQNIAEVYRQMVEVGNTVEVSIKLDGESATFYTDLHTKEIGAAQRNYALRVTDVPYTRMESFRVLLSDWMRFVARRIRGGECAKPKWKKGYLAQSVPLVSYFYCHDIAARLKDFNAHNEFDFAQGKVLSIQGEMIGPNFNHNAEEVDKTEFFVYRAYLNGNLVCTPLQTRLIAKELGLRHIPVLEKEYILPTDMKDLIKLADGPRHFDPSGLREGIVVKDNVTSKSFKVISNKWLEKNGK